MKMEEKKTIKVQMKEIKIPAMKMIIKMTEMIKITAMTKMKINKTKARLMAKTMVDDAENTIL